MSGTLPNKIHTYIYGGNRKMRCQAIQFLGPSQVSRYAKVLRFAQKVSLEGARVCAEFRMPIFVTLRKECEDSPEINSEALEIGQWVARFSNGQYAVFDNDEFNRLCQLVES